MRCAVISSKDLFGPENLGKFMSATRGIMMATFLSPDMDVNARIESLQHFMNDRCYASNAKVRALYNAVFEQPTVTASVAVLCKQFGLTCTPRIEANLREAVLKLALARREELKREIAAMEVRRDQIMRFEKELPIRD